MVTDYPDAELVENLKFNVEALVKDFGVAEGILEAEVSGACFLFFSFFNHFVFVS